MIALLLTAALHAAPPPSDLEERARELRQEGRYVEALAVLEDLEPPPRAGLLRALVRWEAGDLGGALREVLAHLDEPAEPNTRRRLLWHGSELALQLGEARLALDLVGRWEEAVVGAPDLTPEERARWTSGWAPATGTDHARARAERLAARLDAAHGGVTRAQAVTAALGALALLAMILLGKR